MPNFEVKLTGPLGDTEVEADEVRNVSGFVSFERRTDDPINPWELVRQFKAATVLEVRRIENEE